MRLVAGLKSNWKKRTKDQELLLGNKKVHRKLNHSHH